MSRKIVQEERRVQIIKALYRCLQKKPFAETSIKDIAKTARVNHGVLHYYFKSKEDILLNFIDYIIEDYRGQFRKWLESQEREIVESPGFIKLCLGFMTERITLNRDLSRAFVEIWEIAAYNRTVRNKLRLAYVEWIDTITAVVKNAGLPEAEARRATSAMIALYEGLALFSVIMLGEQFDVKELLGWFQERAEAFIGIRDAKA